MRYGSHQYILWCVTEPLVAAAAALIILTSPRAKCRLTAESATQTVVGRELNCHYNSWHVYTNVGDLHKTVHQMLYLNIPAECRQTMGHCKALIDF